MKSSGWLILIAAAALFVGLALGFAPMHSDGYNCGSAFHERKDLAVDEIVDTMTGGTGANGCDEARGNRQVFAWLPIGLAVVLGVGALVTRNSEHPSDA